MTAGCMSWLAWRIAQWPARVMPKQGPRLADGLLTGLVGAMAAAGAGFVLGEVPWQGLPPLILGLSLALGVLAIVRRRARAARRVRDIERDLPFVFDMMVLCVEAGMSVQGALSLAARSGPAGELRNALERALVEMRAGLSRAAAIRLLAERSGSAQARNWAAAISQAEALGSSLGPVLRTLAEQGRNDRRMRAEQMAMQAPVKMLLPLIGCIFPCTFIVLAFPVAVQLSWSLS